MADLIGIYDPEKVNVTIISVLGSHRVSGFGEGAITLERVDPELFKARVGIKGETTLARNRNRTGTVTIPLLQGSPSRNFFDGLKEIAQAFAIQIDDGSETGIIAFSEKCVMMEEPSEERGSEAADVEWKIWCQDLTKVGK